MRFFASAKINLMLHITGRRADGYHLLQSAMALTDLGDVLHVEPADAYSLRVEGPFAAHAPVGADNLITRAVRAMEARAGRVAGMDIRLRKNLPAGAGLGGGSADAAAAMHALNALWGQPFDMDGLCRIGLGIGAELPFMIASKPAFVEGVGDVLKPLVVPPVPAVVIWPGFALSTAEVFGTFARSEPVYTPPIDVPEAADIVWLRDKGNDLLRAALQCDARILDAIAALDGFDGCAFSRMTGSGSSVFGVFETMDMATEAAQKISGANPAWWARACVINPSF